MISIRAQLLWSLLPAFAILSVVAGLGVYFSTQAELVARLDARLAGFAVDLQFAQPGPDRDAARKRFSGPERARSKAGRGALGPMQLKSTLFTNLPANVFCEVWLGEREIPLKTDNLEGGKITRPEALADDAIFYDATLPDGAPLRAWAARLSIKRGARNPEVILAVDRAEVDETLDRLARNLVGGGVVCCLILSLSLIVALRASLRPLRRLGEQATTMDAESLHERFSEKSAPSDIRPIVERLNILMAKLEESFARERRFSGDLAHELRTPLAAIRTTSEVALKWPDQASPEDFEEIHRLSFGLQQTLDSLLLLARMESSAAEQAIETVNLSKLAEECLALHAPRAEERGVRFDLDLQKDAARETDPRLARIIFSNLIGNAVEYAPEGSAVSVAVGAEGAVFQCANDAPYLAEQDIAHLFERMWRKDAARTESGHAGLGLSIAKACATALNLDLVAELDERNRLRVSLRSSHPNIDTPCERNDWPKKTA